MDGSGIQVSAAGNLPQLPPTHSQFPPTQPSPLVGEGKGGEAERARLKKAATEFESFFLYYMLKTMRQAVPKAGLLNSKAADSYMSLFDQEVANLAAKRGGLGLQKMIENQFFPSPPHRLSFDSVPPIIGSEEEGR